MNKKIEILSPCGDHEALVGALCAGADAVYLGIGDFNARLRAKNFTLENIEEEIRLAHAHGAKVYITINTALYDKELGSALNVVRELWNKGADAFIVADLGVARVIKSYYREIELHASTQCTVHNLDGADFLHDTLGFSRVVLARELDKGNIEYISKKSKAETEIFIHGAHCMSVSGQCLMSYFMGGRSGNRGMCAQPCRLSYKIGNNSGYHLSLKDMSLSNNIPEILSSGAASLKIEGRMKNSQYVKGTTEIYKRLISEKRNATKSELSTLTALFSRGGFTNGYFNGKISSSMLGVRSQDDKDKTNELENQKLELKKPKADIYAELYQGQRAKITLTVGKKSVTEYGEVVNSAINAPTSKEDIIKNLSKLGNTPFALGKIEVEKSENIMVPLSLVNALRRKAIDAFFDTKRNLNEVEYKIQKIKLPSKKIRTAFFVSEEQIPQNRDYFDIVFIYADKYKKGSLANGIMLPPVIFDSEWEGVKKYMSLAKESGVEYALLTNIGQIKVAKEFGFKIIADYRFNIFNAPCVDYLMEQGMENVILSPEISLAQARAYKNVGLIAYGKIPAMTTHKCVIKDTEGCDKCEAYIKDRQGACMYTHGIFGHRNVIYNSVPIYMADKQNDILPFSQHFIFSNEKRDECFKIIEAYKASKGASGNFKRIK